MKNVTVSIDDETYRQARITAAHRDQSISALVRDLLRQLAQTSDGSASAKQERLFASFDAIEGIDASKRLSRSEAHER